jgi:hypothetical protein
MACIARTAAFGVDGVFRSGAPEEIRTPDPQIRSLAQSTEILEYFCKPLLNDAPRYQWLTLDLQTDQGSNYGSCTQKIDLGKTAGEEGAPRKTHRRSQTNPDITRLPA